MRINPFFLACALLTVFAANAPHAAAQQGRWNQAFRHTGSQAMKSPVQPHINASPVYSPFDLSGQVADFGGYPYPDYPLCYSPAPWPIYVSPQAVFYPVSPLHYGRWNRHFPIIQSFSVQQFSIQITAPQLVSTPGLSTTEVTQQLLQPPPIQIAFDPADPQLLNFAAPASAKATTKPLRPEPGLPGVAAQPVPAEVEQGIVLRGKRKLADGRK